MPKSITPTSTPTIKRGQSKVKTVRAYEVLSDADKKQKYDQFGHAAYDQAAGGGYGGYGGGFGDFDIGDIWAAFFGGGFGGGQRATRMRQDGRDLGYNIDLSFEEACFGAEREITINHLEKCDECGGSGAAKGSAPITCPVCHGTGQVTSVQRTAFGDFQELSARVTVAEARVRLSKTPAQFAAATEACAEVKRFALRFLRVSTTVSRFMCAARATQVQTAVQTATLF